MTLPYTKVCPRCRARLPRTRLYWYERAARKDGLSPYCRLCTKETAHPGYEHRRGPIPVPAVTWEGEDAMCCGRLLSTGTDGNGHGIEWCATCGHHTVTRTLRMAA